MVYKNPSVEDALIQQLDNAAELGKISASDYRKLSNQIFERQNSKDPYGSNKTVGEAAKIESGELTLDKEKSAIVVSSMVADPSMAQSTLLSMDYDYNTKTLRKDVLNAVNAIQKSGVMVRKHTVEETHTALGGFEIHTFELKPIDGQASSIRVKLPLVDDDGTFSSGGNKYLLRKQRVD